MNSPFFSVIITTYNRADLVSKTIDSVLAQEFRDFEIIVVDNKSTDNIIEVLQLYVDAGKIRFYQNDRNYERAYSRNRGFSLAKGTFLTLLDSDDILYPSCLAEAHQYILQHAGIELFHAKYDMISLDGNFLKHFTFPSIDNPLKALAKGNFLANLCIFYKKELAQRVRFDEEPIMTGIEDYDFLVRMVSTAGHLGRIDRVLGGLREHPHRSVHHEKWENTYKRVHRFIKIHTAGESKMSGYSKLLKAHLDLYFCSFHAVRYNFASAWRYAMASVKHYPAIGLTSKFWIHQMIIGKYLINYLRGKNK